MVFEPHQFRPAQKLDLAPPINIMSYALRRMSSVPPGSLVALMQMEHHHGRRLVLKIEIALVGQVVIKGVVKRAPSASRHQFTSWNETALFIRGNCLSRK